MQYLPINDNVTEKLHTQVEEGYTNLAKWIIAISTGAIAFGVSLVRSGTTAEWKQGLFSGLVLLGISILLGVRYVRLRLDGVLYNLEVILNERQLEAMKKLNPNDELTDNDGKKLKRSDLICRYDKGIKETEAKMERINKDLIVLSKWQQRFFYLGIGLIMLFGVLSV